MRTLFAYLRLGLGVVCYLSICKCPAKLQIKKAKNKPIKLPSLFYAFFYSIITLLRYAQRALLC